MCLINFHFQGHPNYRLIIAANRDEAYNRPTAQATFWEDEPKILAGRDLLQMGTWLGVTKQGQFAALTNYRDPSLPETGKFSRGEIVRNFLTENKSPEDFLDDLQQSRNDYAGFNLLVGNADGLYHYNNILDTITKVLPGTHGLSNHTLDTPWPKVVKGRKMLAEYVKENSIIEPEQLFKITSNAEKAPDEALPDTGVGIELERLLSPLFIKSEEYGTRSSTVLLIDKDNHVTFVERTYQNGIFVNENAFRFDISSFV